MKRINVRLWMNESQRRTLEMFFYLILLAAGCMLGTLCLLSGKAEELAGFCTAYAVPHIDGNIMLSSMKWCSSLLTASFFLGFCGIGQPFLCLLLAFHGFGTGCALAGLFSDYLLENISVCIIAAVFAVLVSMTLLLGVRESVRLSFAYIKAYFYDTDTSEMRQRLRMCFLRYIVLAFLITAECGFFALAYNFI